MSGCTVRTADGYQAALEAAKIERFDVAVCDIALWDGDGCDLLKDLQKLQTLQGIAVTGFTLDEEVEHYREAGFAAVLPKPVDPSQVIAAISRLTSSQAIERPIDLRPLDQLTEELGHDWNDFFTS
jgi:CheY-like chemotaxis protein